MLVCGVDEAGRGSMLGPLVVAGVAVSKDKIPKLRALGIRDSKALSAKHRLTIYKRILDIADAYSVYRISPGKIDRSVSRHELNMLEAKYMARIVAKLTADVSYVDSCDVNPRRFGTHISRMSNRKIRSYHKADARFAVVAAASIVAKVRRDREITLLKKTNDVGSGYPSDSKTVRFVRRYIRHNNAAPPFARASWKPVRAMLNSRALP